jgi:hypothetical protein
VNHTAAANAAVAGITKPTTLSALVEQVERAVTESGGTSNPKAAGKHLRQALATAEALGILRLTKPTDIMIAPVK